MEVTIHSLQQRKLAELDRFVDVWEARALDEGEPDAADLYYRCLSDRNDWALKIGEPERIDALDNWKWFKRMFTESVA